MSALSDAEADMGARVIVGCINWNQPAGVPRAISYVLANNEMRGEMFHPTWAQAMMRANELAVRLRLARPWADPKDEQ